ncbi:MAG: hypothetical protein WC782_15385 [Methylococcaceae bacterium]|jgi:nucleoside phosphorylase
MSDSPNIKCFIYCALPCEAKALIEYFRLKQQTTISAFAIYSHNNLYLTVTGIGKSAMAAGVAYSQALFADKQTSVILNIGIAGHLHHHLGQAFLIDKITDADSLRCFYPPHVFSWANQKASLQTLSRPSPLYHQSDLYDMEASAFYETATRFTSSELVQCLKIVSDNTNAPLDNVKAKLATQLITEQLPSLDQLLAQTKLLAEQLYQADPVHYIELVERYHFSSSQRLQLKNLLLRYQVLTNTTEKMNFLSFDNAKSVLEGLNKTLQNTSYYL